MSGLKSTALTLNLLAVPALAAAAAGLHHPGASTLPATLTAATETTAVSAATAAACQAWEPLIPGLLYLETTPVITLGGVPLLGGGTCEPTGKGYDISLGANIAIPPGSACSNSALLKINLGLAIGVPDESGTDPCQVPAAPAAAVAPRVVPPVPPAPPQVVPPAPPQVVPPVPPQVVPPVAPSAPALAPPPPARSAPALAPPPPAPVRHPTPPPPPATTPAPAATTPAAVLPPPPPPRRPRPPQPPAPVAAAVPAAHPHKPAPRKPAPPKPVPTAPFFQAAPPQPPAPAFKPGQPVLPVGVLVTVVMTPCVATVAARLGKIMAGHAA
jgi:hypothetical protein